MAWLSCSGRLSRVGEDYRVGWGDMGEVTKDSIQKLYFEQRIRPLIHALQQPPATSHQPPTKRISDKSAKLAPYSSFLFYLLLFLSSFQFSPLIFDNNLLFCMSLLFMLSHTHMQSSEACFLWILLVVRLPRSFSHCQLSAVGGRRTEDGITKICRSSCSLRPGWRRKRRPIMVWLLYNLWHKRHTIMQLCSFTFKCYNL